MFASLLLNATSVVALVAAVMGATVLLRGTAVVYAAFVVSLFMTSFLRVDVAGMAVFPYFFMTLLAAAALGPINFSLLFRSKIFWAFSAYIVWTAGISILRENEMQQVMATGGLRLLLLLVSGSVALILLQNKIAFSKVIGLFYFVLALNAVVALCQFATGSLTFTYEQEFFLGRFSRPSGLFPEPDALGKFCMVFVLVLLPVAFASRHGRQKLHLLILALGVLAMFASQARSSLAGFVAGMMALFLVSSVSFKKKIVVPAVVVILGGIAVNVLFPESGDLLERMSAFTSMERIDADPSGRYRLQTIRNATYLLDNTSYGWISGLGWFEMGIDVNDKFYSLPSSLILYIIFQSGIVGLSFCLYAVFQVIFQCGQVKTGTVQETGLLHGVAIAMVGAFVTSLLAPMWFDPVLWTLIGIGMFCELFRARPSLLVKGSPLQ